MTPLKSPFCLMTTSTLLPISIQKTMSQDQIEDLAPEEYSLFLADGEFSSFAYRTTPHGMVMSDQCEIKAHITWV